ncbi:MAG: hypothetical protein A2915_03110 [Candidatus Yanofskybacteria bacterium RIFCSPLOWO2_01_FULL_41_34]|uniref:Uncharacterized protein n=1 Tax=Candidatus Yanofskybacteria bacterium RIFCSPHIGHO2_01_FULL_41_26 TaxID=1802661 RepID=A0A1F8EFV7_9BACT|nr:MAG: hypothetical protein A2649_01005 [Candidatus Yanofskybacteria bacterium RIFCSPHIGHO2_01_FULL_41_26]OGN21024.1 MAG: hypothetical protein A2915_03110 [Candidatus Yanofskybacteria bacterium RIFCSPLOWO2_01_FULL_41_34]
MYFNSPDNLPESEKKYEYLHSKERIEHLRRIINGRPVAILAAGPSISELEARIEELSQTDICYFGMNFFFVQEDNILKKINKRFSVLTTGANKGLLHVYGGASLFDRITDFLNRNDDNLLISSFYGNQLNLLGPHFNLQEFLDKYNNKLFFPSYSTNRTVPDNNRPMHFFASNSLAGLIYMAIIGKASKIVLFGSDGYTLEKNPEKTYYRSKEYLSNKYEYERNNQQKLVEPLINDANKLFNPIVPLSLRNIYKTYPIKPVPILNCSEVSYYTPFPKTSYNDTFAFLLGKKNIEEIVDLRIPTASIIIPSSDDTNELRTTLESIAKQSYSNYETVVIKRSPNFLDTMENALSLTKGKYIFYCHSGYGYRDQDWLNSCIAILENRPRISLVCGIPENQLTDPPWPEKKFLYYWLKKKIFFPPNTICVRKKVLEKCLLPQEDNAKTDTELESWLNFNLRFNINGYLPTFISTVSDNNRNDFIDGNSLDIFRKKIAFYRKGLILKKTCHHFRDGDDNILPGKFYLSMFLLYKPAKIIETKLLCPLYPRLNIIKRIARNTVKQIVLRILSLTSSSIERKAVNLYRSLKKKRLREK